MTNRKIKDFLFKAQMKDFQIRNLKLQNKEILDFFDLKVCIYLDKNIKDHLKDSVILITKKVDDYSKIKDFSFLITPAFKALEGYLIQLAKAFKIYKETDKHYIGNLFALYSGEKEIFSGKIDIYKKIKEKLKDDKEGLLRWNELSRVLKLFRHSPAHYGSMINTFGKAEGYIKTIYTVINETTLFFLEKDYIKNNDEIKIVEER